MSFGLIQKITKFLSGNTGAGGKDLPAIVETRLLGVSACFEALVPEDYDRILNFDGERSFYEKIVEEIRPGDCFWDIGSFIGMVSVFVARNTPEAQVVAVEPDEDFCSRIKKNLTLNQVSNVELLELGLADKNGTMKLNTSGGTGWAPSFFEKGLQNYREVPIRTIDFICQENPHLLPDVLKIDVEGFESHVIRGASAVLSADKLRTIFLEIHPSMLTANSERIGELLYSIEQNGFRFKSFQCRKDEILSIARRG